MAAVKCIVLQNGAGDPLGFLLCSPGLDHPAGDCVFVPSPVLPDGWAARLLAQRWGPGEEGRWLVEAREPLTVRVGAPPQGFGLFVVLGGPAGGWGFDTGPDRHLVGRAVLAADAEPGGAADPRRESSSDS